jgi:hypothetical protein
MKTLRRVLSFVLLVAAVSSMSACSDITAFEDCNNIPGSNNLCD